MKYNPSGYRFFKGEGANEGDIFVYNSQGQLVAKYSIEGNVLKLDFMPIYEGTKRLGIWEPEGVKWEYCPPGQLCGLTFNPCFQQVGSPVYICPKSYVLKPNRKYELTDHLNNVRVVIADQRVPVSTNGTTVAYYKPKVKEISDYYPYGWQKFLGKYQFGANAGSLFEDWDSTKGTYYTLYRLLDSRIARWYQVEPRWEEYAMWSGYVVNMGNPMLYVDVLGDSIFIEYNGKSYLYLGGKVYDEAGNEVESLDGFLKQAVDALNKLRGTETFGGIVGALEQSKFSYFIKYSQGDNHFKEDNRAGATILTNIILNSGIDTAKKMFSMLQEQGRIGSGGTVYWDPNNNLSEKYGLEWYDPTLSLAHELAHAYTAMLGIGYYKKAPEFGPDKTRDEWSAMYFENLLRRELGLSLREYYRFELVHDIIDPVTGKKDKELIPRGLKLIKNGEPYLPPDVAELLRFYGITK